VTGAATEAKLPAFFCPMNVLNRLVGPICTYSRVLYGATDRV
jgi:hypothetical protein